MKIAVLTTKFPPGDIGGAEISAYNFARLASKKHDIHVITREQDGLLNGSKKDGFNVHTVSCRSGPGMLRYWSTARALAREAVKLKPDLIYSVALYSAGMGGAMAGKRLGVPVVIRLAGEIYWTGGPLQRRAVKKILAGSNLVIALTEHMKKEVLKYHEKTNVVVIGEGVDYDFFRNSGKATLPKNSVLYIGRFVKMKGTEYLVRAFKSVKESVPDARLYLGGYGPEECRLKAMAKGLGIRDVKFLGKLERKDMARYLKGCTVFALPSTSEGFPLTIVEAMSAGCPIVSTNVRGLPEILRDGKNGLLVNPMDQEALAEKIAELLKNRTMRQRFSKVNIRDAKQYSWKEIVPKILKSLESLL